MPIPSLGLGPELTEHDLMRISQLVYEKSGIRLHAGKRALVTARLQKRVRQGGFASFRDYLRYVQHDTSGSEVTVLLDSIATNHTSFFREPRHFTFLRDVVLPPLVRTAAVPVLGWSAACATGEEPYSLAMVLHEAMGEDAVRRARILASDLSTKALTAADAGVYRPDRLAHLPQGLLRRYFERGANEKGHVRVSAALRGMVEFRRINLLDIAPAGVRFAFIFCRNVMIYFDQPAQQRVVQALERRLSPGGYLFISHAESLNGIEHGLKWTAPAVYRRVSR